MSNTQLRIISALVLVLIIVIALSFGTTGLLALLFLSGVLLVDELVGNMILKTRKNVQYFLAVLVFVIGFVGIIFSDLPLLKFDFMMGVGFGINSIMIIYLFMEKMDSLNFIGLMKKFSFVTGLFFLVPMVTIAYLVSREDWLNCIVLLILTNFLVDTGAWFFGKNFGKRKLWPEISPNKTFEGAIGGVVVSITLSSLFIHYYFENLSIFIVISLFFLTVFAQLGDLIESKIKRQLGVKDSSNLIPGHGGIYDRLDSLVFIAPFYGMMIKYLF
ncbi:MAG: phosphatidate cytidylyltransferase [Halobacteriovoraceae bacterium]|jgi:phosphatidate cytidylyltransferase|nr:phosphatidate cytidylyltransferase [Halobacteriovoraceae bacterium]